MFRTPLNHLARFLCGLCACTATYAQSPTVDLRFISFPKVANPEPLELLIGEGETIEVEMPTNHISQAYKVPALSKWVLGKSSESETGKVGFNTFGEAASLKSKSQLVLVMRSGEDLEVTTLDYSPEKFGGGQYLFMNATRVDIAGVIGEEKFALKPGKNIFIAPKPTKQEEGRNYSYARFYFRNQEEAKGFFSATWRLNERARSIVFFYHDPGTKQIRLHTIRSFLPGS